MTHTIRLVQLNHTSSGRKVALVQEPYLVLLSNTGSVYELAMDAIQLQKSLQTIIQDRLSDIKIEYNAVYELPL